MNRRWFLSATGAVGLSACTHKQPNPATRVIVVATMHRAHKDSASYTYEDLYQRIAAFGPTAIGVEIRKEDLSPPAPYLSSYYPAEMIELARRCATSAAPVGAFRS